MNQQDNHSFVRGDIVELVPPTVDDKEITKQYNRILNPKPDALIILKPINEMDYLVVLSYAKKISSYINVPTSLSPLYVNIKSFYVVNESLLLKTYKNFYLLDKRESIAQIYDSYKEHLQRKKFLKEKRKQEMARKAISKRNKKREKKKQEQLKLQQYRKTYNLAVINNDRETMNKIISIIGYDPHLGTKDHGERGRTAQKCNTNPKPYCGGSFCSK